MEKRLLLVLSIFSILTIFLPSVNAMYYHQSIYPDLIDNHTMRYYALIEHPREEMILSDRLDKGSSQSSIFGLQLFDLSYLVENFNSQYSASINDVTAWNYGSSTDKFPYQFFIKYDIYPNNFNTQAGYQMIQFCDINITQSKFASTLEGVAKTPDIPLFYKRITDTDVKNQEYYIELARGDSAYVKVECYYTNSSDRSLITPINLYVVSPTYECSKCNAYEWSAIQPTLYKADYLQNSGNSILENIKRIVVINYEFFVYTYWIIIIGLLIFSVGLIFMLGIYLYKLVKGIKR